MFKHLAEKPKIIEAPSDVVVSEHGDVLFQCRATGDPEPITIWKKQKGLIPGQRSVLQNRQFLTDESARCPQECKKEILSFY